MGKAEKLASLKSYVADHLNRLAAPVPEKHAAHADAYRAYLQLEIAKATKTIDKLTLELGSAK